MGSNYLLTIGAIVLLSVFILTTNTSILRTNVTLSESEFIVSGVSLAQALLDEMKTKAFDEKTIIAEVSTPDSLSTLLGSDVGESVPLSDTSNTFIYGSMITYDDIDDYNGYSRLVDTPNAEEYVLSVTVEYSNPINPGSSSAVKTYCKTVIITITSPYISLPLSLDYAFTY